jgi:uncharacterized membrane protein
LEVTFTKIFGVPAHPLFVHVPVVLIPIVGIGAIAMACSAWVRERFGWLILAIAVVAGLSTQLAIESGQALRRRLPQSAELRRHAHIAESIRPLILLLFLVALAVMLVDRRGRSAWPFSRGASASESEPAPEPARGIGRVGWAGLIVLTAVVAVGTNVRLFQIGDSGAKATWQRVHLLPEPQGIRP